MKKRMLSMLLILVMIFSLVCTLNVSAYADNTMVISDYATLVTVKKGQTLIGICSTLKVNYNDVKNGIIIANNFSSDTQLSNLTVGEKIWIPTSKANSTAIVNNAYAFDENGKATNRTTGGGITSVNVNIPTDDVITYKVKSGDTIGKICKANNLTYDIVKEAIVKLNPTRFSTVSSLGKIQVNWTIYLPASDAAAKEVVSLVTTAEKEIGTTTSSSSTSGDTFWGYVVKHTMSSGETVKSVCNALGKSYSTDISNMVVALNNLKSASSVKAGYTYWFPSATSNGTGYTVYSHTVVSGDTCGNLCTARGLSYNKVSSILQGLNPSTNLSKIKVGYQILILGGAVSSTSTSSGGVNIVVGGTQRTITIASTTNGTATASTLKSTSGSKVTITATPDSGYAVSSIDVYGLTSNKNVASANTSPFTFTMPDENVKIVVTFKNAGTLHTLKDTTPSASGSVKFLVNGTEGTKAYSGDTITVVPTAKKSGTDYLSATYTYSISGKSYSKTIEGRTFTMPDSNVSLSASFSTTVKVTWDTPAAAYGTLTVSYNGSNITSGTAVTKDTTVAFSVSPKSGYVVDKATVNGVEVTAASDGIYYFKPDVYSVIEVTFKKYVDDAWKITKTCTNCSVSVVSDGAEITSIAKDNSSSVITITPKPNADCVLDYSSAAVSASCGILKDNKDGTWTLTEVTGDVTITVNCKEAYNITTESAHIPVKTITVNEQATTVAAEGTTVEFTVAPETGYSIVAMNIEDENGNVLFTATAEGNNKFSFAMPAKNVVIAPVCQTVKNTTSLAAQYTATIKVNGSTVSNGAEVKKGDTVVISFKVPLTYNKADNSLKSYPVISGATYNWTKAEKDANFEYYDATMTVGETAITFNLDSCWS